ncbi:MAG: hypothetical protein AAFX79_13240 [Planctomycetota bacterium]
MDAQTLHYVGIDEAGYGPMLGPLCVGVAWLVVRPWTPGGAAPDLWSQLAGAVSPAVRGAAGRLVVADSKKTCQPLASGPGRLREAERTVSAFARAAGSAVAASDADLFEALGVGMPPQPWYAGAPAGFPAHADAAEMAIAANALRAALPAGGVEIRALRVIAMGEDRFNAIIERGGSKAATTLAAMKEALPTMLSAIAGTDEPACVRMVLDRQGGRTRYAAALADVLGRSVTPVAEAPAASVYAIDGLADARVRVQPEAELEHFPVALASMAAKLVREMLMERFNAYWGARRPGIRPTAGYTTDARRWLGDMADVLDETNRRAMIRLA